MLASLVLLVVGGLMWVMGGFAEEPLGNRVPLPTGDYRLSMVVASGENSAASKTVTVSTNGDVLFATLPPLPLVVPTMIPTVPSTMVPIPPYVVGSRIW